MMSAALPDLAPAMNELSLLVGGTGSATLLPVFLAHAAATFRSATRSGVLAGLLGKKSQIRTCACFLAVGVPCAAATPTVIPMRVSAKMTDVRVRNELLCDMSKCPPYVYER